MFFFSEFNTSTSTDASRVLFKRDSKSSSLGKMKTSVDEERSVPARETAAAPRREEAEKAMVEQPAMTDVFSWQHLNYIIRTSEGNRILLDNISGYVAPGKLTALMGESGAGKVSSQARLLNPVDGSILSTDHTSQCSCTTRRCWNRDW